MTDPFAEALNLIASVFGRLGIRYAIGGSLASSTRGIWRSTMYLDLIASIAPAHVDRLVEVLGPAWYADADMIRESIGSGRPFNVIHIASAQKIDIFPATEAFHNAQLDRASPAKVGSEGVLCPVTTAEDILLAKLRWYRAGGEVSDRQWGDVTGILATNPNFDFTYARSWAARLEVEDLLDRAIADIARDNA